MIGLVVNAKWDCPRVFRNHFFVDLSPGKLKKSFGTTPRTLHWKGLTGGYWNGERGLLGWARAFGVWTCSVVHYTGPVLNTTAAPCPAPAYLQG